MSVHRVGASRLDLTSLMKKHEVVIQKRKTSCFRTGFMSSYPLQTMNPLVAPFLAPQKPFGGELPRT